jgi:hypothetical protein
MRFDLQGQIPIGAVINSASLRVMEVDEPSNPADAVFDLHRLLKSWSETEVTWNSASSGSLWQFPGASGSSDSAAGPSSSIFVSGPKASTPVPYTFSSNPGLVGDVQAWVADPASNFGWLLQSEDEVTYFTARRFGSREDPVNTPVLTIDYSIPSLSILVQPQSQTNFVGSTVNFSVEAGGAAPFSYQWLFNGTAIPGQTNSTLTVTNIQSTNEGLYVVTVSNQSGSTNSEPAFLRVESLQPGLPVVTLLSPTNGAKFPENSNVLLIADASESNGVISQVEFFV